MNRSADFVGPTSAAARTHSMLLLMRDARVAIHVRTVYGALIAFTPHTVHIVRKHDKLRPPDR